MAKYSKIAITVKTFGAIAIVFKIQRLAVLIEAFPPSVQPSVEALLAKIRAPSNAEFMRDVAMNLYRALDRLAATVPASVEVRAAKKIAWQLIEILLRQPRLSEDNTASLKDIAAGPLYQALAIPSLDNWAHEVMLDALVSALVLDFPNQFAEVIAQELISSGGLALSPLPEPEPELHLGQVLLVSKYFSTLPSRSERQLLVAGSLEKVAKQFLGALTPQPIEANVKHVTTLALGPEPSSTRSKTNTDRLNALTKSLAVKLAEAVRSAHLPVVRLYPAEHEVAIIRRIVTSSTSSDLKAGVILVHAVLGQFAQAVLGVSSDQPRSYKLVQETGAMYLSIAAPTLHGKNKKYEGEDYRNVTRTLNLGLPKALVPVIEAIRTELRNDEAVSPQGKGLLVRAGERVQAAGRYSSVGLTLKRVSRLLSARLEPGGIDRSILHLLGLSAHSQRDGGVYYFSPSIDLIRRKFEDSICAIAIEIGRPELVSGGWTQVPNETAIWFGTSMRLSIEQFREVVGFLVTNASPGPGRSARERLIRAFNSRAALATLRFLAGSGARPTGDVFPDPTLYDTTSGLAVLSEKDSLHYRSTRIAYLAPGLDADLEVLRKFEDQLAIRHGMSIERKGAVRLLEDDGTVVTPSLANMKRLVPGFADVWRWERDDVLRHHFRSRAWELGCPSDVLAKIMGHTGKSQTADNILAPQLIEGWNRKATPYITDLLNELGFPNH